VREDLATKRLMPTRQAIHTITCEIKCIGFMETFSSRLEIDINKFGRLATEDDNQRREQSPPEAPNQR
jgi:hypothetical protein